MELHLKSQSQALHCKIKILDPPLDFSKLNCNGSSITNLASTQHLWGNQTLGFKSSNKAKVRVLKIT